MSRFQRILRHASSAGEPVGGNVGVGRGTFQELAGKSSGAPYFFDDASSSLILNITATGTPEEAKARVEDYKARGCTCPVLYPLGDAKLMIDTFSPTEA